MEDDGGLDPWNIEACAKAATEVARQYGQAAVLRGKGPIRVLADLGVKFQALNYSPEVGRWAGPGWVMTAGGCCLGVYLTGMLRAVTTHATPTSQRLHTKHALCDWEKTTRQARPGSGGRCVWLVGKQQPLVQRGCGPAGDHGHSYGVQQLSAEPAGGDGARGAAGGELELDSKLRWACVSERPCSGFLGLRAVPVLWVCLCQMCAWTPRTHIALHWASVFDCFGCRVQEPPEQLVPINRYRRGTQYEQNQVGAMRVALAN